MPPKAEWLLRVPEILAELRILNVPVLDSAAIQRPFNFQRRRAIQFMHAEGGNRPAIPSWWTARG